MWEAQFIIINEFGRFVGRKVEVDDDQFKKLCELSRNFYGSGFELTLEDGSFIVLAPEIVNKSILQITKNKI